jgi:hypothetical protein
MVRQTVIDIDYRSALPSTLYSIVSTLYIYSTGHGLLMQASCCLLAAPCSLIRCYVATLLLLQAF